MLYKMSFGLESIRLSVQIEIGHDDKVGKRWRAWYLSYRPISGLLNGRIVLVPKEFLYIFVIAIERCVISCKFYANEVRIWKSTESFGGAT